MAEDEIQLANLGDEEEEVPLSDKLTQYVNDSLIGREMTFRGPFGRKQVTYADMNSAGRGVGFIEDFIRTEVMPAATDAAALAMTTVTGLQTTMFLDEARNIFRRATNSGSDDEVMFGWSNRDRDQNNDFSEHLDNFDSVVVFVDTRLDETRWPWPWMLTQKGKVRVIDVPEDKAGTSLDLEFLKEALLAESDGSNGRCRLIGCFSACSRMTGMLQDDLEATALVHRYGGLAFWDYSVAGPTTVVDMNPQVDHDAPGLYHKDAVFLSGSNLVGGLQSCDVVVVKRALLNKNSNKSAVSMSIIDPVRASLAMQFKMAIGASDTVQRSLKITDKIEGKLSSCGSLILLGGDRGGKAAASSSKLATYSFVVAHPDSGLYIHHNFVCALFNDLFGIQARSFSAASSRQGRHLFHLSESDQQTSPNICSPGYVTVDIPWFYTEEEAEFILDATIMVATEGWKILPQYVFNIESGEFLHHTTVSLADMKSLNRISYDTGEFKSNQEPWSAKKAFTMDNTILKAKDVLRNAKKSAQGLAVPDQGSALSPEAQKVRWFLLPQEAKTLLCKVLKMRGPIVADRLNIRRYDNSSNEGNDTTSTLSIGTLGGATGFVSSFQDEFGDRDKKIRGFWLSSDQGSKPVTCNEKSDDSVAAEDDQTDDDPPLILTHQQTVEEVVDWQEEDNQAPVIDEEAKAAPPEEEADPSEAVVEEEGKEAVIDKETQAALIEELKAALGEDTAAAVTDEKGQTEGEEVTTKDPPDDSMGRHQLGRNLSSIPEEEGEDVEASAAAPSSSPTNSSSRPGFFSRVLTRFSAASALKGSKVTPEKAEQDSTKHDQGMDDKLNVNPPEPVVTNGTDEPPKETYIYGWNQEDDRDIYGKCESTTLQTSIQQAVAM